MPVSRSHGWLDYQERLGRVTAYIHDHLESELDLDRLAEVAHLSSYHWHRVYHALYGETIAATVRRLRLHRASGYLANTTMAVTQVARKCGYPNVQSFARAFRVAFAMSPSDYRQRGGHAVFLGGQAQPELAGYSVEIRTVPVVQLAGLPHRGSYMRIGKAFETAYTQMAAQGLARTDMRWMAVYDDDPFSVPEAQLNSRAGLSLPPDATARAPLVLFELGGGTCAVLRHKGPYATMRAAYQWLYGQWLVQSGYEAANLPVFEEYLNNPRDTAPAELLTDIFLPLAARSDQH
ncbi:GyrI-like domain-containing protein [Polaromonas sp. A23]|uniref:AraC family transcriptional regulator n=1 Tax=Polaromonas sp. A23 TaxID=1944133 RepID=UPI000985E9A9|nr:AraC family transcriptional regulator [Polaromonas sp. A23]OOG37850.1 GyrI-like domain-containing protein [Polaromonas sp. A23]